MAWHGIIMHDMQFLPVATWTAFVHLIEPNYPEQEYTGIVQASGSIAVPLHREINSRLIM